MRLTALAPDLSERDRLVMQHVALVKTMAQRLAHRLPSHVELGELTSAGVIGLIDAAGRYRGGIGVVGRDEDVAVIPGHDSRIRRPRAAAAR